jgi:hypothetical protein
MSIVSALLLAMPGLQSALHHWPMLVAMVVGVSGSIGGMALRWHSHRIEIRQKSKADKP